ncbi:MAG: hypothetical protein KKE86_05035 [Planctomycetes bacterium]|nr:hypothetical protein [Planctomycetota bacterium]MBU4398683.1 hypothetical protein [Planctomycetota bacterium]MCG2684392.1 hypothetical protein [Planctomycetales bacterium]
MVIRTFHGFLAAVLLMTGRAIILEAAPIVTTVGGPADSQMTMIENVYGGHDNWGGRNAANVYDGGAFQEGSRRILIRFDLPPLQNDILAATLELRYSSYLSNEGILRLYRLTESWGEGTGSGHESVSATETGMSGGTGCGPQDGAADWFDRFHGTDGGAWSVPGAVGGTSSIATPTVTQLVTELTFPCTVILNVLDDVRYWYANGVNMQNFGWVMTEEDSDGEWRVGLRFYSNDALSESYNYTPILRITSVPEPAIWVSLVFGAISLITFTLGRRLKEGRSVRALGTR